MIPLMRRLPLETALKHPPQSVLVVDDDHMIVHMLKHALGQQFPKFEVTGCQDSRQAYELLRHRAFDLLLTDLCMPELDGMDLIQFARQQWPQLPVMIVTGVDIPLASEPMLTIPNSVTVKKPIPFEQFYALIEALLLRATAGEILEVHPDRIIKALNRTQATAHVRILLAGENVAFRIEEGEWITFDDQASREEEVEKMLTKTGAEVQLAFEQPATQA